MMSLGLMIYLIMGTTAYLLIFKRSYMIESNKLSPKIFLSMVCVFGVFVSALMLGYLDPVIFG